jgi:AcrR family transcriptional regulator
MPRSSREKSEETRLRIIESAYHLFLERGYHGTSMRNVSQRAGLTVGAIYNHFPNKEDLWKEIIFVKHPYHEILPLIQSAQGDSLAELVRSAAHAMVATLARRPDLLNLMFIEMVEFGGKHIPSLIQVIIPEAVKLQVTIEGKQGQLRDIPVTILLRSFVGLFFSYYITGVLMNLDPSLNVDSQSLDQFVDLYLYGILSEDDPSHPGHASSSSSSTHPA